MKVSLVVGVVLNYYSRQGNLGQKIIYNRTFTIRHKLVRFPSMMVHLHPHPCCRHPRPRGDLKAHQTSTGDSETACINYQIVKFVFK